jgi:hypothetical protein
MARDTYHTTISLPVDLPADAPDIGYLLKPMAGIRISVYARGTTNLLQVFQRPTGATEGPTPECGATGGPNPFTTGPSGDVEFWVDGPKEVDVAIADTQGPPRITARTLGWNAIPAAASSIPSSILAQDGTLTLAALAADVTRQMHQIGEVIDWWRPADTVPVPAGYVICDGTSVPAGSHDFPVAGAINVPDLRNRFILGADATKPNAQGANQGNAVTDAPGVAGTGGSNAGKSFAHGHGVPGVSHIHLTTTPDHFHTVGALYTGDHAHAAAMGDGNRGNRMQIGGTTEYGAFLAHQHSVWTGGSGAVGIGGNTGGSMHSLAAWSSGPNVTLDSATNTLSWTADPGSDMRPRFIGLLKLMKVKRA